MKLKKLLLIVSVAFVLAACNLKGSSNYTPTIYLYKPIDITAHDTLKVKNTSTASQYLMDTVQVGDTVKFAMFFQGYSNFLTNIQIEESADSVTKLIFAPKDSLDILFKSTSDNAHGRFVAPGDYNQLYFAFKYKAKKVSKTAYLKFTVVSDANFDDGVSSNTSTFTLLTPIKAK